MAKPQTPCVLCGVVKVCQYAGRCIACYRRRYYKENSDKVRAKDEGLRGQKPDG